MLNINFIWNQHILKKHELKNTEFLFGIKFPKEYKDFLILYNGWKLWFSRPVIEIHELNQNVVPELFFWINTNSYDLIQDNLIIRKWRYPSWFVSISSDPWWNSFLLWVDLNNSDYWKVYFWDHENENPYEWEEPWMENMYLVANSFTEFMEKIHPDED